MDLSEIRKEYRYRTLDISDVNFSPILQLELWLNEAAEAQCQEHTAMVLSTSSADGQPSNRVVLLKYISKEGLSFFTNYKSRKGKELLLNPKAAACFFWPELERQIRIEGHVVKADPDISDFYFRSRPYESQISAIVSPQSSEIANREILEREWRHIYHAGRELERPDNWGGYLMKPNRMEFWQGRPNRLHDRIIYKKQNNNWIIKRLAP